MDNRYELRRLKLANDINDDRYRVFQESDEAADRPEHDIFARRAVTRRSQHQFGFVPQFSGNDEILRTRLNLLLPPDQQIGNPNVEIPGTPSFLAGGFNRSLANIFRTDAPNYSVGVTISFPFRNRTAKANLAGAQITRIRSRRRRRQQEQR